MERSNNRHHDHLRPLKITRNFTRNAAGSVLIQNGDTHVLCTASIDERVPFHVRGTNSGWVTGEYSLLPGSTVVRSSREASRGRLGGRTQEIQRLIGRSLRSCTDMAKLGERSIIIDCDVLQADGGTRCASITGGYVALVDAVKKLLEQEKIEENPIRFHVASVAVGVSKGEILVDMDYSEDGQADVDMNFVGNENGEFIEVQGTAERNTFDIGQLAKMAELAQASIQQIIKVQKESLASS